MLILVILLMLFAPSFQQQNICGPNNATRYFADPSHCYLFLRCNWRNDEVYEVNLGQCDEDYPYFYGGGPNWYTCTREGDHCSAPLSLCPPESESDIMIADPYDQECRRHRPCRQPTAPYSECRAPLIFNRNTGLCDFAEFMPCRTVNLPPRCNPGDDGFFLGNRCYQFFFCLNGELMWNFECLPGLYFNETARSCLFDTNNTCPRNMSNPENPMPKFKIYEVV